MKKEYRTIATVAEGFYSEKRSKFLAHAVPVTSPEEALEQVALYQRKYYDARHLCWAYLIGHDETPLERSNDDGEPSGTAGKPILGQLHAHQLTDVLILVARYFGGVKLGTSGLISAYRQAAINAIEGAKIETITLYTYYTLSFPYSLINPVMVLMKSHFVETLSNDSDTEGYLLKVRTPNASVEEWEREVAKYYQLEMKRTTSTF